MKYGFLNAPLFHLVLCLSVVVVGLVGLGIFPHSVDPLVTPDPEAVFDEGNPFDVKGREALAAFLEGARIANPNSSEPVDLREFVKGKSPSVLFFLKLTDCFICVEYVVDLAGVASASNRHDILFVGVHTNPGELESYFVNTGIDFPFSAVVDAPSDAWQTPFAVVLDRNGKIRFANSILRPQARQEILTQRFHDVLQTL